MAVLAISLLVESCAGNSSAHGVLQQQHNHYCITMHAALFVQRDGYLSHLSLGSLELVLAFA